MSRRGWGAVSVGVVYGRMSGQTIAFASAMMRSKSDGSPVDFDVFGSGDEVFEGGRRGLGDVGAGAGFRVGDDGIHRGGVLDMDIMLASISTMGLKRNILFLFPCWGLLLLLFLFFLPPFRLGSDFSTYARR